MLTRAGRGLVQLLFAASLVFIFNPPVLARQKTVSFTTKDGCRIEAFFSAPSTGAYVFINTHGLGSDKNEWSSFQAALEKDGYGYLSPDMRGHGKSRTCRGKAVSYRSFTKADWARAWRDIAAAGAWLKKKGYNKIIFCGASIGANLSLKAAAEGKIKPSGVVMLSPGLDYAGIKPASYLDRSPDKLLILAADDDPYAWRSSGTLGLQASKAGLSARVLDGGSGHGAAMLKDKKIIKKILGWAAGLKGER